MKTKKNLKHLEMMILLIISIALIIGCKPDRYIVIFPGYSPRSIAITDKENRFSAEFEEADSLFDEEYELPLTR